MTDQSAALKHPSSLATHLAPLRRNWGWLMAAGIALVVLGTIGLGMSFLMSLASTIAIGVLALIGGVVMLVDAFRQAEWKSRIWYALIGLLYIAAGLVVFYDPVAATAAFTLLIGAAFLAVGVMRIIVAFQVKPAPIWAWVLVSGLLSVLLGILILAKWPASSFWALGTLMAIELIFQGWADIMLAWAIRSTNDGVRQAPTPTPKPA